MKLQFNENERHCCGCGEEFVPRIDLPPEVGEEVICLCPNGCGRYTMATIVEVFENRELCASTSEQTT